MSKCLAKAQNRLFILDEDSDCWITETTGHVRHYIRVRAGVGETEEVRLVSNVKEFILYPEGKGKVVKSMK